MGIRAYLFWIAIVLAAPCRAQGQPRLLQPAEMEHDLTLLRQALTRLHPDLYVYQTPEQLELSFASLRLACREAMDERQFYVRLAKLTHNIRNAYTGPNPNRQPDSTAALVLPKRVLPILFRVVEGHKLIVTANLSTDHRFRPGDELAAINGIKAQVIIDSLAKVIPTDGLHAEAAQIAAMGLTAEAAGRYNWFDVYFPLFFGSSSDFFLTLKPLEGKPYRNGPIKGFTLEERKLAADKLAPNRDWEYRFMDPYTAYLRPYRGDTVATQLRDTYSRQMDSAYRDITSRSTMRNVIIDLRATSQFFGLSRWLPTAKVQVDEREVEWIRRILEVPDSLLPYIRTDKPTLLKGESALGLYRFDNGPDGLLRTKQHYHVTVCGDPLPEVYPSSTTGKKPEWKVVLLLDAASSSFCQEEARLAQARKQAIVVGESGQAVSPVLRSGFLPSFTLPFSGIEIDLPVQIPYYLGVDRPILHPDYPVHETQKSIAQGRDVVLEKALSVLK